MTDSPRSLAFVWLQLMALSLALGFAANVSGGAHLGAVALVCVGAIAALKARLILRSYLGLSRAPGALAGFSAAAWILLALVAASFLIFPTPARNASRAAHLFSSTAGAIE